MRTANPVLNANTFLPAYAGEQTMTVQGTANKSVFLLFLLMVSSMWIWDRAVQGPEFAMPFIGGGALVGLIVGLIIFFKPAASPVAAPIYALAQGLVIGGFSGIVETKLHGLVLQAALLTFGTLFAMLVAYRSGWIRVTEKLKLGIAAAVGGVAFFYLVTMILRWCGVNVSFMYASTPLGIGLSAVIVIIAALNLLLNISLIHDGASAGAPKYMEWYCGYALLIALIWLYLEILDLLIKLNTRRD